MILPLISILLFLSACAPTSMAASEIDSGDEHKRIVLYPGGISLINIMGNAELNEGVNTLTFTDFPSHNLDPATLSLIIDAEIRSQKFQDADHGLESILTQLEGEQITLVSSTGNEISGILLSYQSGMVHIKTDDDRRITLPNLHDYHLVTENEQFTPQNMPAATWEVYADQENVHDYSVRYMMRGLNWKPEYELHIDQNYESLDVHLNAVLQNHTGSRFDQAELIFMTGDIQLTDGPRPYRADDYTRMEMAQDISREEAFEYYRYVLSGRHDIDRNEARTFTLERADDLTVRQRYRGQLSSFGRSQNETQHFRTGFVLQNTEEYGLGFLMPAGRISVYQEYEGGQDILGQDQIRQKAVGEEVFAETGRSSDITWRERQISMEQGRHGENLEEREITLINRSDREVEAELALNLGMREQLHDTDMEYEEISSRQYLFKVALPAQSEVNRALKLLRDEPRR